MTYTAVRPPTQTLSLTQAPTQLPTALPTISTKVDTGTYVRVIGTGGAGLRFRSGPGQDFVTLRILPEGEVLKITGGPEEADGIIWWRAMDKSGLVGWVPESYVVPVSPPAWTPQPERTPDLREVTPTPKA